jgi:ubiquinone/menaquinone biosynthesis C-methylase UbiE
MSRFYLLILLVSVTGLGAGDDRRSTHCSDQVRSFSENNRDFYNKAGDWLDNLSERKGIALGEDLTAIAPTLEPLLKSPSARVLEIGAGRGRVIHWLLKNFPQAQITGVDQSERTVERLSEIFKSNTNVSILHQNTLQLQLSQPVSLALWMWSGFAEISAEEKPKALQRVLENLLPGGAFVIDMPREIIGKEKIVHGDAGRVELQESFGTLMAHVVSEKELKKLAAKAGFNFHGLVHYETTTGIKRTSYIFIKPRPLEFCIGPVI